MLKEVFKMFLRNPLVFFRLITLERIRNLLYLFFKAGRSERQRVLDYYNVHYFSSSSSEEVALIEGEEIQKDGDTSAEGDPEVSIIIPVYNQWEYTKNCISSIHKHVKDVSYEILVGDDCSTDETINLNDVFSDVIHVRHEQNGGFLLNCNWTAKKARGKYLVLLNNDTQVHPNWLESLVNLMKADPEIGIAGSKLVYPDGTLQEAGGIFWNDGSAWNYGRNSDPNLSQFNYVKECDYISGASIMIRANFWKSVDGFDETFVPAYCEDSDLAFTARSKGYKVVYQPASVVTHFEGKSHGTDESQGIKKYQVDNSKKLFEKWKSVLEENHFPNAENVFLARDRSRHKKHILVIDHYVPHFDKDAGSRTIYQYLQLMTQLGHQVTFIGDNYFQHPGYTEALQDIGVEVLYGIYYAQNWEQWLAENGSYFDSVMLNRPHITIKYLDKVLEHCSNAKICYYGHDLHYLRDQREYELTNDAKFLESSKHWKGVEHNIIKKCHVGLYPSIVEIELLRNEEGIDGANVEVLQPYALSDFNEETYVASKRKDLLFVGGFSHKPNVDAMLWFVESVYNQLSVEQRPVLNIVGSNPPYEITELASDTINVTGFVSDDELREFYLKSKLVVVPLRYGAGIKGKVVEAMGMGLPILSTSIGIEGMVELNDTVAVADESKNFIEQINELLADDVRLTKMAKSSLEYVKSNYSIQSAKKSVETLFFHRTQNDS